MRALLRVDGGRDVGMGHLVRATALASALRESGLATRFATASTEAAAWLEARGEKFERIDSPPGGDEDANQIARLADEWEPRWIVTDGYVFREEYLKRLVATRASVVSIDDLAAWFFPSSVVVNGGLGAKALQYSVGPSTKLLLGPEYLLLRAEFRRPAREAQTDVRRVFACFGGADPEDWTAVVLEAWAQLEGPPSLELVVGPAYAHAQDLLEKTRDTRVRVHRDLDPGRLAELMSACDLAVASAGMVACELAALGVPQIVAVTSENQRGNARALSSCGAARLLEPFTRDQLVREVQELVVDHDGRGMMARAARQLVDGWGASRVAAAIVDLGTAQGL